MATKIYSDDEKLPWYMTLWLPRTIMVQITISQCGVSLSEQFTLIPCWMLNCSGQSRPLVQAQICTYLECSHVLPLHKPKAGIPKRLQHSSHIVSAAPADQSQHLSWTVYCCIWPVPGSRTLESKLGFCCLDRQAWKSLFCKWEEAPAISPSVLFQALPSGCRAWCQMGSVLWDGDACYEMVEVDQVPEKQWDLNPYHQGWQLTYSNHVHSNILCQTWHNEPERTSEILCHFIAW